MASISVPCPSCHSELVYRHEVMKIEQITELPHDIQRLVLESKSEGFRFLGRLVDEFNSEVNLFDGLGEILLVVRNQGNLIAIGGVNNHNSVGRLRRFYVSKEYRRIGVGSRLLQQLEEHASKSFPQIILFTDTLAASRFYEASGYITVKEVGISHRKKFTQLRC